MLWDPIGRWVMPKALANPKLAELWACVKPGVDFIVPSLDPVELSGLSTSISPERSISVLLLCRLWRLELTDIDREREDAPGPGVDLGGAAAIGTTPLPPTAPPALAKLAEEAAPADLALGPASADGDSPVEVRLIEVGAGLPLPEATVAKEDTARDEFRRDAEAELVPEVVFLDLVPEPPPGTFGPEPRLRFLMTSVFRLNGRTTPWSFKNSPHALQRGWPSGLRRHRGVVCVKQLVQVVGALLSP